MWMPYNMKRALITSLYSAYPQAFGAAGPSSPNGANTPMGNVNLGNIGGLTDIGHGFQLASPAAEAFRRMATAAQQQGVDLYGISNTYRSVQQQQGLWNQALQKYGSPAAARKWVAPPGNSMHNKGLAIDFSSRQAADWMSRNSGQYGWQNYSPEWWHFNYKG